MANFNDSFTQIYYHDSFIKTGITITTENVILSNSSESDIGDNITNKNYFVNDYGNYTYYDYEPPVIPLLKQPPHLIALYSIAYGLVFIFGLIGNSSVIAVIIKEPSMRNVTNYFILNLSVADMLVTLLVVPITLLSNLFTGWLHLFYNYFY